MGFTIRLDYSVITREVGKYLCSLEVTALMTQHGEDSVMATNVAKKNDEPRYVIGGIDKEPLYTLERTSTKDERHHDYKAVPLFRTEPYNYRYRG